MNQELRSEIDCRLCLESGGPCIDASLACDDGIVFAEKVSTLLHIEVSGPLYYSIKNSKKELLVDFRKYMYTSEWL